MLMLGENWFPSFVGVQRTRKCWQNTVQRNTQRACECYRRSQTVTSCVCVCVFVCMRVQVLEKIQNVTSSVRHAYKKI
jgi:hypothetical protein